jgi:hypothetical protein
MHGVATAPTFLYVPHGVIPYLPEKILRFS